MRPLTEALLADGIPSTSFAVGDVTAEFERLRARGVRFAQEPAHAGGVVTAVLENTCGNLIQIVSGNAESSSTGSTPGAPTSPERRTAR